ncbi:fumarate hydratase 1, mitochondrial-like [Amaranthus tricolor]|uniref:fumarate hydratase 1, mitochondrial-like n=1 Tax=Amaranthus tricolor TaxID=29722 RepID=UPI002585CFFC|nr:fumarate hydratase 1, mitochondrial-like [Amaranthus tricolor]
MPKPIIRVFGVLKECAGKVNMEHGLDSTIGKPIMQASQEVDSTNGSNFILVVPRYLAFRVVQFLIKYNGHYIIPSLSANFSNTSDTFLSLFFI